MSTIQKKNPYSLHRFTTSTWEVYNPFSQTTIPINPASLPLFHPIISTPTNSDSDSTPISLVYAHFLSESELFILVEKEDTIFILLDQYSILSQITSLSDAFLFAIPFPLLASAIALYFENSYILLSHNAIIFRTIFISIVPFILILQAILLHVLFAMTFCRQDPFNVSVIPKILVLPTP